MQAIRSSSAASAEDAAAVATTAATAFCEYAATAPARTDLLTALDALLDVLGQAGFHYHATALLAAAWRARGVGLGPARAAPVPALAHALQVASKAGLPVRASSLCALLGGLRRPASESSSSPFPGADRVAVGTLLLRWYIRRCEATAAASGSSAAAAAGSDTHPSASAFNALLRLYAQHGLPPPESACVSGLGYRPGHMPAHVAAAAAGPASASGSSRASAGGDLYRANFLPSRQAEPVSAAHDARSHGDAGGVRVGQPAQVSAGAYLWQQRGGLWLQQRDNPVTMAGSAPDGDAGSRGSSRQPQVLGRLTRRPLNDAHVGDATAWLARATEAVKRARRGGADAPPTFSFLPAGHTPAVDVPPNARNEDGSHTSPGLRVVLLGLWREMTGQLVYGNGVAPAYAARASGSSSSNSSAPNGETLCALLPLCANAADVAHVVRLGCDVLPGGVLGGAALSVAVQQAVRFGDVQLALAAIQAASARAVTHAERQAARAARRVRGAGAVPAAGAAATDAAAPEAEAADNARAALVQAGLPRAAVDHFVAAGAALPLAAVPVPFALPVPPTSPLAGAIADAYCTLVVEARAAGANLAAAGGYYACLAAGIVPSGPATAAALRAFSELGFDRDVYAAWDLARAAASSSSSSSPSSASTPASSVETIRSLAARYAERVAASKRGGGAPVSSPSQAPPLLPRLSANVAASAATALGRLGDAPAVVAAFADYVNAALLAPATATGAPPPRLGSGPARCFVRALAEAGDLPAAVEAARAALVMGATLPEDAFAAVAANVLTPSEVASAAYPALELMAAAGVAPGAATEAALAAMCGTVAREGLPVPAGLASRAVQPAAAASAGAAATARLASSSAAGARLALGGESTTNAVAAVGQQQPHIQQQAAAAHAHAQQLSAVLGRFSVFAGNSAVGSQVVSLLRSRLFGPPPTPAARAVNPLAAAVESARSLCAAIIRWTVQHVQATAAAAAVARGGAVPPAAAAAAGGNDRPAAAAADDHHSNEATADDEEEESGLSLSREMLLLALQEWPVSQATHEARAALAEANVPRARVAAARRRRAAQDAQPQQQPASSPAPYASFAALLASSRSYGEYLAAVRAPRAPLPLWEAAALARDHGGRTQHLPAAAFGPRRFWARLNADEDGSGLLGARPVLRAAVGGWTPPLGLRLGFHDALASLSGEYAAEMAAVGGALQGGSSRAGPSVAAVAASRAAPPTTSSSSPAHDVLADPASFGLPDWERPFDSDAVRAAAGVAPSGDGSQAAGAAAADDDDAALLADLFAADFVVPATSHLPASPRGGSDGDEVEDGEEAGADGDEWDAVLPPGALAQAAMRYKLRASLRKELLRQPAPAASTAAVATPAAAVTARDGGGAHWAAVLSTAATAAGAARGSSSSRG